MRLKTRGYVDGFNLYKGALEGTAYKWLDLAALCDRLAGAQVNSVAYCTARLVALPGDPGTVTRQDAYLRALSGNPRIETFLGKFTRRTPRMYKVADVNCVCCSRPPVQSPCACCSGNTIQVVKFEEKGSDVQLAVQLVRDAYEGNFDRAVVISNDSDLQPAIDVVRTIGDKEVIVVNPHKHGPSLTGTSRAFLSGGLLASSQMPPQVRDARGHLVRKPAAWK